MAELEQAVQSEERDLLIHQAKIAKDADRYDNMVAFMKAAVETGIKLNSDERRLLSVANKHVISALRSSWRVVKEIEGRTDTSDRHKQTVTDYRVKIEGELRQVCNDLILLLETFLIPMTTAADSKVFYLHMKADACRYLAELQFATEADRDKIVEDAQSLYEEAYVICRASLQPTEAIRLGLVLNYSVFHYEILKDQTKANELAKLAFDEAIGELDTLDEESYNDSTMIMQLLKDNLNIWEIDPEEEPSLQESGDM